MFENKKLTTYKINTNKNDQDTNRIQKYNIL